jgi:ribosomal protein S8
MSSTDLENLSREEKQLVRTLYEEGYISQNTYLQIKAKNSTVTKPESKETTSDKNFDGEDRASTWYPEREDTR